MSLNFRFGRKARVLGSPREGRESAPALPFLPVHLSHFFGVEASMDRALRSAHKPLASALRASSHGATTPRDGRGARRAGTADCTEGARFALGRGQYKGSASADSTPQAPGASMRMLR